MSVLTNNFVKDFHELPKCPLFKSKKQLMGLAITLSALNNQSGFSGIQRQEGKSIRHRIEMLECLNCCHRTQMLDHHFSL